MFKESTLPSESIYLLKKQTFSYSYDFALSKPQELVCEMDLDEHDQSKFMKLLN